MDAASLSQRAQRPQATISTAPPPEPPQSSSHSSSLASSASLDVADTRETGSDHIAVLTDGGQDSGLAVLINSFVKNGFDGTLWVGWRGQGAELFRNLPREVVDQFSVRLVELETQRPLTFYKPDFLQTVWGLAGAGARSVCYTDCDIVLGCDWSFISAWAAGGVAVVEDLPHRTVGPDNPVRRAWKSFMTAAGVPPVREIGRYFNAGFIGIPEACREILPLWSALVLSVEGMDRIRAPGPEPYFVRGVRAARENPDVPRDVLVLMSKYLIEDQDALNMALMASNVPICAMGPDAMGFTTARTPILVHALGADKPWSTKYIRRLMRYGVGPSFADDMWWLYSDGPLRVPSARVGRRWSWRAAKALGRYM